MSRKQMPGLSRERIRVFAQVLEHAAISTARESALLGYILGELEPDAFMERYPTLRAAVIAAEAGTARSDR
jgi:hypothetical protein